MSMDCWIFTRFLCGGWVQRPPFEWVLFRARRTRKAQEPGRPPGYTQAMLKRLYAELFSAYCSLILTSALMAAAPQAYRAAVAGWTEAQAGVLSAPAQAVSEDGADISLAWRLSQALGLSRDGDAFPMKQKLIFGRSLRRTFNVSRARGRVDIVLFSRSATEGVLYLTSVRGELEKAVRATKTSIVEVPRAAAAAGFETEKAWWLARLGAAQTASLR